MESFKVFCKNVEERVADLPLNGFKLSFIHAIDDDGQGSVIGVVNLHGIKTNQAGFVTVGGMSNQKIFRILTSFKRYI